MTASISATLLFYLLGRSIAAIQLMAHGPLANQAKTSQQVITGLVDTLSYLLPDLDRFPRRLAALCRRARSSLLVPVAAADAVYLLLLSGVALFDLYRKNF